MLASRKKMHQDNLEDYINVTKELKDWSDEMNCSLKSVNVIEGKGHTIYERLDILNDMKSKLAAGQELIQHLNQKSEPILQAVGEMDKEQVHEQIASFERRFKELGKQIARKAEFIQGTEIAYKCAKGEIEKLDMWMKSKISHLEYVPSQEDQEVKLNEIQSLSKEVSAKKVLIESLTGKIGDMKSDLEESEYKQLNQCLHMLVENHLSLEKLIAEVQTKEKEIAEGRKILDDKIDAANTWIDAKRGEFFPSPDFNPLKAFVIEKKLVKLKKAEADVRAFEETEYAKSWNIINALDHIYYYTV